MKRRRRTPDDINHETCVLTLYRFDMAPVKFRRLFEPQSEGHWLAHVDASVADSINSLLSSWAMQFRPIDRRTLPDGSVLLVGEFDASASDSG